MPSTTFNLKLDPAIKPADYSYVYFVAFDQGGNAVPINGQSGPNANVIKLIDQGTIQPITTATINQGANQTGYYPSNYYVVMQHSLAWASDLSSLLSEKANITTDNAVSSHFNFTMVEAVLTPSVYDQIDISALNNFGPNVAIKVNGQPADVVSSSGFNASFDSLQKSLPTGAVQGTDKLVPMILGPNANADLWPTEVWKPYLDDIIANPRVAAGIKSQYFFNANTLNLYQLSTQTAGTTGAPGSSDTQFVLSPLFPGLPGANTNVISMSYSDLQNAIYAPTFGNDANGFAKSYLVSGFDAGLWGANATYTNPNTTHTAVNATTGPATIDLSNSWNWSQLYNYDGATAKAQGVTVVDIGTGGEKLALTPGLASTYNPLSYFDYNDLKTGVFYQMLLDQPKPAPTDLANWSTHLANGGDDIDVAKALMTTLAQQQPALTDTDFVGLLYRQGLGRAPQSNELNAWLEQLEGGTSRSEIAVNFANLPEMWANDTIKGVYSAAGGISTIVDWSF